MKCALVPPVLLSALLPAAAAAQPAFTQSWLAPTAQVHARDTVVVSASQLLLLGISLTLRDNLEINAKTLVPVFPDAKANAYLSTKWRFFNNQAADAALHIAIFQIYGAGQSWTAASASMLATYCFAASQTMISGMLGLSPALINEHVHLSVLASFSAQQRLGSSAVYALGEVTTTLDVAFGDALPVDGQAGFLGLRFVGHHTGIDLGVMHPLSRARRLGAYFAAQGDAPLLAWINLRYRYGGIDGVSR